MTIMELMVASTLGLIVVAMTMSTSVANRDAYGYDIVRTRLNQNIRGAFDIINAEVRQAGERLPAAFPAIELVDGASGGPDTLILRRNLLDEVVTVCRNISMLTSGPEIYMSTTGAGTPPACVYGSQTTNYNAWRSYRLGEGDGGKIDAYIFDLAAKVGEFFLYDADTNTSATSTQYLRNGSNTWHHNYSSSSSAVYMLSEWKFSLSSVAGQTDLLQLTMNEHDDEVRNVVYGIDDIQFRVLMQDGTVKTSFTKSDNWTLIQSIEVTVKGAEKFRGRDISSTLTTQLFPRNVLSN